MKFFWVFSYQMKSGIIFIVTVGGRGGGGVVTWVNFCCICADSVVIL